MKETKYYFLLEHGRKLFLRKGYGWQDSYLEKIIQPVINDLIPQNAQYVASSENTKCWNVPVEDSSLLIKFFNFGDIFDRLFFLRKSRSLRAWEGSMLLLERGFSTPTLIAQGDITERFLLRKTFFITNALKGSLSVYEYLDTFFKERSAKVIQQKRGFIIKMGRLIGRLHKAGIFHGDLRPGNILIVNSDNDSIFYFIDNERNRFFSKGIPQRLREKNLVQINMILKPQITFSDRMRFFKAYLIENPELEPVAKRLIRRIFLKTKKRLTKKISGVWGKENGQN